MLHSFPEAHPVCMGREVTGGHESPPSPPSYRHGKKGTRNGEEIGTDIICVSREGISMDSSQIRSEGALQIQQSMCVPVSSISVSDDTLFRMLYTILDMLFFDDEYGRLSRSSDRDRPDRVFDSHLPVFDIPSRTLEVFDIVPEMDCRKVIRQLQ